MSSVYTPAATELGDITLPDDGDTVEAADVNVPLAAIADGVAAAVHRRDVFTAASGTWHAPADGTIVIGARGAGGGGGGGPRGNSTNTDGARSSLAPSPSTLARS